LLAAVAVFGVAQQAMANVAPVPPAPIATKVATEGQKFAFTAPPFADSDGDILTYSFSGLPTWIPVPAPTASPSYLNRYLRGTPPYSESSGTVQKSYTITYIAVDPSGASDSTTFELTVINLDAAPVAPASIPDQTATEQVKFAYTVPAFTSPDGDTLTYSFSGLPPWLSVSSPSTYPRYISGKAPYSESSSTVQKSYTITVTAEDPAGQTASQSFTLAVEDVDLAPVAPATIPNQTATEQVKFAYTVPAFISPDGEVLTYSFSGLPVWMPVPAPTASPSYLNRYLRGTPPYSESSSTVQKSYTITAIAQDPGGQTASKSFTLSVVDVDLAPVAPTSIPNQTATELLNFGYAAPAFTSGDGDVLTYSFSGLPAWLTVSDPIGNPRYLSGTPPKTETTAYSTKIYPITVTARDPGSQSASQSFNLTIYDYTTRPGLDSRPSNTTCLAPERPTTSSSIQLGPVFANLTFINAVALLQAPGDASRWFVVRQNGVVRVFDNTPSVATSSTFIDIKSRVTSGGETGLLGMAFHPNWPATPEVFLSYTRDSPLRSVISRFTSNNGGLTLDATSEQVLLTIDQPYANHNGGNIVFGPDGMLYAGFGDGGNAGDPQNRSQNLTTLLGKMLRINVTGTGATYTIPADNPFSGNSLCTAGTGTQSCPEIWAFGFRNPWRWSFDRATGDLWVGDVGQNAWEEVDSVTKGGNYAWRQREGAHCYNPSSGCATPGSLLNGAIVIDPVTEYAHDSAGGESITGGYVYRGSAIPGLAGQYVFGDYISGRIWSHAPGAEDLQKTELLTTSINISSFGEGLDGELYVLSYSDGKIYNLEPSGGGTVDTIPTKLSETGCVDPTDPARPASGLIPFQPNAPFWSDGAAKERFMGLPDGQALSANASGDWDFPNGTVLVKNFRISNKLIETRLFMRHPDGVWGGYSYEWNDAETEATRVLGGKNKVISGQTWVYPSEQQCLQCHTEAAGHSLGLETAQQNGSFRYPQTGRTANQVMTLNAIGAIAPVIAGTPDTLPVYRDPYDTAFTLSKRARAYLHSNCSQCHRPGGPTPTNLDFRYTTALSATNACDALPDEGDLGVVDARIIAPGAPERSLVLKRVASLDPVQHMPPLGTTVQDTVAVQLLNDWILQLQNCN
jgi:uncharacterized repeat protein (TIGR03806 family)